MLIRRLQSVCRNHEIRIESRGEIAAVEDVAVDVIAEGFAMGDENGGTHADRDDENDGSGSPKSRGLAVDGGVARAVFGKANPQHRQPHPHRGRGDPERPEISQVGRARRHRAGSIQVQIGHRPDQSDQPGDRPEDSRRLHGPDSR